MPKLPTSAASYGFGRLGTVAVTEVPDGRAGLETRTTNHCAIVTLGFELK
ncbi:MAG: hypothetical protein IIC73_08785 [Armatimonadetes bacterium]|nr:hypothetical protein [Armatimonadota bacterium]